MSLIKQLWIGIIVILLLALGGSFAISLVSAKVYLQNQLQVKNIDNATSLALSMSQLEKDPVTMELLIAAQFDAGHYQYITLSSPSGEILVEKSTSAADLSRAPRWFAHTVNLKVNPGIAQIQDGWQQHGTLTLASQTAFAVDSLWHNALNLLSWFLIAALVSGLLGTWILKTVSRPLDIAVEQAEAIGNRRFITTREPRTHEFRRLVRAMNTLSGSVKVMLEKETRQLEVLRRESQQDAVTGLFNRSHFFSLLDGQLLRQEGGSSGAIFMLRVLNLAELNHTRGHQQTDQLLHTVAQQLLNFGSNFAESFAGRLNGSDFALVISDAITDDALGQTLSTQLAAASQQQEGEHAAIPLAWGRYSSGDDRHKLMHQLDGALAQAEVQGDYGVNRLADGTTLTHSRHNLNDWRDSLSQALSQDALQLASFPVKTLTGAPLHTEAPARLHIDQQWQPAGYFVPWAIRSGLMPALDLAVVQEALKTISTQQAPLAINISTDALRNASFRHDVTALLQKHPTDCRWLWLEFPESAAVRCAAEFRSFSAALREVGCHVGLEHVGMEFTRIDELQNIGLDYLKIDSSLIHDIHTNTDNQALVKGMTAIGHSLGMVVIAEGVSSAEEIAELTRLGLDGVTGPGV